MRTVAGYVAIGMTLAFCLWGIVGYAIAWGYIGLFGSILTFPWSILTWIIYGPYILNSWVLCGVHAVWVAGTATLFVVAQEVPEKGVPPEW